MMLLRVYFKESETTYERGIALFWCCFVKRQGGLLSEPVWDCTMLSQN